jgi:AcrR family transcriptional regulator
MTSQRHILAAARDCVCSVGVRRTTLTDIARRAGVSRMTVYRQFPDVTSVVAALMTREFGDLLAAADTEAAEAAHARGRLVGVIVDGMRRLSDNPLLNSVLDRDAELLLPYLVQRVGSTQKLAEGFLADRISAGHADGSIRRGSPSVQARVIFQTAQAFVVSHRPASSDVDGDELRAELTALLHGALRPTEDA